MTPDKTADKKTVKRQTRERPTKLIEIIDFDKLRKSNAWSCLTGGETELELYKKQVELVTEARLVLWRALRASAVPKVTDEQREEMISTACTLLESGKFLTIDTLAQAMDMHIQTFYTHVRHDARFAQCFDRLNESKVQAIKDKAIQAAVSGEELPNFREVALVLNSLDHNKIVFSASGGSGQSFVLQFANSSAPQEATEVVKAE